MFVLLLTSVSKGLKTHFLVIKVTLSLKNLTQK